MTASAILVDSVAGRDDAPLHEGAVIDVLPPFAGG
jgi:molybdopterin converting factor small subunit